ncbi:hypothetical protein J7643_08600 [bacterium]|nr:hypothetical protein [bacterium]
MTTAQAARLIGPKALSFLKAQAADGFQEALDLQFGLYGHPVVIASVFPVGLVLLGMLAHSPEDPEVRAIAAHEAAQFAMLGEAQGWRYYNLCPEIPPDTDDLAVVTALFHMVGAHQDRLIAPLETLASNAVAPGRFRTWLADSPEARVEADRRWGVGPDPVQPEVTAHMLWALGVTGDPAHAETLRAGARWLASLQANGIWETYNYYGAAYGTYQALRLYRQVESRWPETAEEFRASRAAAREALLASQDPSGGWVARVVPHGVRDQGGRYETPAHAGALETAFALSALACLASDPAVAEASARGWEYLASLQAPDGGFAAEPYYYTIGLVPHQSRCLTTAAVLAAAAHLLHNNDR